MMNRKDCTTQGLLPRAPALRLWPALGGCVLAFCCAQAAHGESIRIRPKVLIDHDSIRLADVAVLDGFADAQRDELSELVISSAPEFGQNKLITLDDIRGQLIAAAVNMADVCLKGSSRCVVRRPTELPAEPEGQAVPDQRRSRGGDTLGGQIERFIEQ